MAKRLNLLTRLLLVAIAATTTLVNAEDTQQEPWNRKTRKSAEYSILYEREPELCRMLETYYENVHTEVINRDWGMLSPVWDVKRPPSDEHIERMRTPPWEEWPHEPKWASFNLGDREFYKIDVDNDGTSEYVLETSSTLHTIDYDKVYIYKCKQLSKEKCGTISIFDWLSKPISWFSMSGLRYTDVSAPIASMEGSNFVYSNNELSLRVAGLSSYLFRYAGQTFIVQHPPLTFYRGHEVYVAKPNKVEQLDWDKGGMAKATLWCAMRYNLKEEE